MFTYYVHIIFSSFPMQFQFVNSFLALFYTAFWLQDMDKLKEVLEIDTRMGTTICSSRNA